MAIFRNSRYTKTPLYNREGRNVFKRRPRVMFRMDDSTVHEFIEGDRLDAIAKQVYNDPQLWWVILEANNFKTEADIPSGTLLSLPSYKEVMRLYG